MENQTVKISKKQYDTMRKTIQENHENHKKVKKELKQIKKVNDDLKKRVEKLQQQHYGRRMGN